MKPLKAPLAGLGALTLACAAIMTSCGTDGSDQPLSFNTYSAASTYTLVGSGKDFDQDADLICGDSVSLVMPITLENTDAQALRDTIMSLALGQKAQSIQSAMDNWLTATAAEYGYPTKPATGNVQDLQGFDNVRGFIVNLDPELLVYCVTTDQYEPGAAHGMTTRRYINYSLLEGKVVSLKDLFTPQGLRELPARIADQAENMPAYAGQTQIEALPEDYNFYISSEGEIVFSYAPYEAGPFSLGTVEIPMYPYELVNLMTPRAIDLFNLADLND